MYLGGSCSTRSPLMIIWSLGDVACHLCALYAVSSLNLLFICFLSVLMLQESGVSLPLSLI